MRNTPTILRRILLLLMCCVLTVAAVQWSQPATTESIETLSKLGSRGTEVRQIQTKLRNWGYYSGSVDGIYGSQTQEAVRYFQRKNGLSVDGIAGPATLSAMGINNSSSSSSADDGVGL